MNGNTRIKVLNCTVKQEAIEQVRGSLYKCKNIHDAVNCALDGAKPGTIGGMVRDYIDGMSIDQYDRFCQEVLRRHRDRLGRGLH